MTEKKKTSYTVALTGNPNVGKSTVFNALTGMRQHTGNWAGKTVGCAYGNFVYKDTFFTVVDLPGCYSAGANTGEEKAASEFLAFGNSDTAITVCDSTCLERSLILAFQVAEMSKNSIICVNLLDEAEKKGIKTNLEKLSNMTGLTVVGTSAKSGRGLNELRSSIFDKCTERDDTLSINTDKTIQTADTKKCFCINYGEKINSALDNIENLVDVYAKKTGMKKRYLSLELLKENAFTISALRESGYDIFADTVLCETLENERKRIGLTAEDIRESAFRSIIRFAEYTASQCVTFSKETSYTKRCRKIDKIVTGKYTAFPIMALLLALILWITIEGANYPSAFLSHHLFKLQDIMYEGMLSAGVPEWICGALIMGVYRVLAWVISVMLPPMAIFFPLFTLLEDLGYLPRIAFNLDSAFKKCNACGKQALTMCMGFGCNAVGVTGCRIIDSKRERIVAIITNVFVPCNGRFPTLITIITMFFVIGNGIFHSVLSALFLTLVICFGILMTFLVSYLLSKTLLKGIPSSFTLELPPYRTPNVISVLLRSALDRTLFVLGRAIMISAPAGLIIWILANFYVGDSSLLFIISDFISPFAGLMGLDGVILLAFILGFPANEIVLPIAIMAYTQSSAVTELSGTVLQSLLISNGWNTERAISVMIFCLCHFPCSTTLMTIFKETRSRFVTFLSALIPTVIGIILCILNHLIFKLI